MAPGLGLGQGNRSAIAPRKPLKRVEGGLGQTHLRVGAARVIFQQASLTV
ncbi:MAG: hypothetical protein HC890_13830 [Chloroflexaceae bacterium]|nr:hypothetical protein [Chloroflexaceae bacterium]